MRCESLPQHALGGNKTWRPSLVSLYFVSATTESYICLTIDRCFQLELNVLKWLLKRSAILE